MNSSQYFSSRSSAAGFVVQAVLLVLLIITVAYIYYQQRLAHEWERVAIEEMHHVQLQAATMTDDLRHIAYTLEFLRDQLQLHGMVESMADADSFSRDMLSFLGSNELYGQIRLLDNRGKEVVRANYNGGEPYIVPPSELQFKNDRDYFTLTRNMAGHEIYISALDLNVENGQVEEPFKPVIRFAIPVFDPQGQRQGVLVINHLAADMLARFRRSSAPSDSMPMLLNREGYWLIHPDRAEEWGFMFEERHNRNMATRSPQLWRMLAGVERGQVEYEGGLVSFDSVYPFAEFTKLKKLHPAGQAETWSWKVVSMFPAQAMADRMASLYNRLVVFVVLGSLLVILSLLSVARFRRLRLADMEALHLHDRALDSVVNGIVICDVSQVEQPVIYCNRGFEQLTGYRREEVVGRNCGFLHKNDDDQPGVEQLRQAISDGTACQLTIRNYRRDGSMFWNELTVSPIRDRSGKLTHYVGHLVDVSQRKQYEADREQLLQEVRRLSRGLMDVREQEGKELARCLHDDFGQMIAAIQLKVMLSRQLCQEHRCNEAMAAIDEVHGMTGGLIDAVREQLRKLRHGHLETVGLVEAIRALIGDWRHSTGINIIFSKHGFDGAISESSETVLYRVVQESLTNIVRHANANHVEVELQRTGDQIRLEISDNGCGFDLDAMPAGMGLVGMRERVQAMDGLFQIFSEPGKGTTVICQLSTGQK